MKRLLCSLLCAALLLALLPAATPAARMFLPFTLTITGTPAFVGGTITAASTGLQGPAPHQFAFTLQMKTLYGYQNIRDVTDSPALFNTALQVGAAGTYRVWATVWDGNGGGYLVYSPDFTVSLRGPAPILAVEAMSASSLRITWAAVPGATGYEVYRATSSSGPFQVVKWTTAKTFTNTYLTTGTRYFYKVRAYNIVGGEKCVSGEFGAAKTGVPLGKASIATIAATGKDRIKLTWNALTGATGYEVLMATASGGPYATVKNTTALSFTMTGLAANKTYFFKLRAYKRMYAVNYYGATSGYRSAKTLK